MTEYNNMMIRMIKMTIMIMMIRMMTMMIMMIMMIMDSGMDNREKDQKLSEENGRYGFDCVFTGMMSSIVFSYTTKVFDSCTAVKEVRMEIHKNELFTLLGPVRI